MKAIKIEEKNSAAIESALKEVNGKSTAHAYTTYEEIADIAKRSESAVFKLVLAEKYMPGAKVISESGSSVAKRYKGSRNSTIIRIERKKSGWYLTDVQQSTLYTNAGRENLILTAAQDDRAIEKLRSLYSIRG